MKRPFQPEWASAEEQKLANEWVNGDYDMPIEAFILAHASSRLLKEYERQEKAMQGMHFGRKVLPDGDILIYN